MTTNSFIVKTHSKALREKYDTQIKIYEELLNIGEEKKIHPQNLQLLMVEVYKCLNQIIPPFTWNYLRQKNSPYNLRNMQPFELMI